MLNGIVSRRKREIAIASEPVKYLRTRKPPAYSATAQMEESDPVYFAEINGKFKVM